MLLTVDVGNSHTVAGVYDRGYLICDWRLKSDQDRTADELAIRYHTLFQLAGLTPASLDGFIVASVVPALQGVWLAYADKYLGAGLAMKPLAVSHATPSGIRITTQNPTELGADRIVNAVAAWHRFQTKLIVIDFGTAITFDCVSGNREYLGGAIMPGIGISLDALAARTAKLPRVAIDVPPEGIIGRNTVEAIRSGILHGFGGMIDRMVEKLTPEIPPRDTPAQVIGTGGMAGLIAPYCRSMPEVDPWLTLEGLRLIYEHNRVQTC